LTQDGAELVQSLEKTSDNVSSVKSVWESGSKELVTVFTTFNGRLNYLK